MKHLQSNPNENQPQRPEPHRHADKLLAVLLCAAAAYGLSYVAMAFMQPMRTALVLPLAVAFWMLLWIAAGQMHNFLFAALLCTAALPYSYFFRNNIPLYLIYMLAFLAMLFYVLHVQYNFRRKSSGGKQAGMPFIFAMVPFCILLLAVVVLLPKSSDPLSIRPLDQFYNNLYSKYAFLFPGSDGMFSSSYGVFGGTIDGNAFPSSLQLFTVETGEPVYLKCAVKDKYDNSHWSDTVTTSQSLSNTTNELQTETGELQQGLKYLSGSAKAAYPFLTQNRMTVTFNHVYIKFLLAPVDTLNIDAGNDGLTVGDDSSVFLDGRRGSGYQYSLSNLSVEYGNAECLNLLRRSHDGLYSGLNKQKSTDELTQLAARAAAIEKTNLQLPSGFPVQVKELAQRVTAGQTSNLDRAMAIARYLSVNETYTLYPPGRASNVDAVSNFLFNTHQGYCTLFASSMTLMLRTLGIPARYCEGYVMAESNGRKVSDDRTQYTITGNEAHAWVEVYFEGFGWMPMDPTAPGGDILLTWIHKPHQVTVPKTVSKVTSKPPVTVSAAAPTSEKSPSSSSSAAPQETDVSFPLVQVLVPLGILLLLLIALAVWISLRGQRETARRNLLDSLPSRDAIRRLYLRDLRALRFAGHGRMEHETPFEFAARLAASGSGPTGFTEATAIFVRARYAAEEPARADYERLRALSDNLPGWVHATCGPVRFFLYHNILDVV